MPSESDPTTFQMPTMTGSQSGTLGNLTNMLSGQIGVGAPAYGGELPGSQGPSELQNSSFDLVRQMLSGNAPGQANLNQTLTTQMAPWDKSTATDWWNQAIKAPTLESWNKDIAPSIMEKFAANDAVGGGGARKALADAGVNLETGMQANLANALLTDKNNASANALKAAGLDMSNIQQILGAATSAGGTQRDISTQQSLAPYQEFLRTLPANNPWLQFLGQGLGAKSFENIVMPPENSSWPGMMGGAGSLLGGLGKLIPGLSGISGGGGSGAGTSSLFW